MPSLRAPRIPGSHAVRILLAGTVIAAAAAIIAARSPEGSGASTPLGTDLEPTATSTAAPGKTPPLATPPGSSGTEVVGGGAVDVTDEGAVDVPAEGAFPANEQVQAATSRFLMPLRQWSHVTDRYGATNRGPGRIHGGIDLALEGLSASPVYSACSGTVLEAAYSNAYGYHVIVDCGDGWTTLSGHFSEMRVKPGDRVDNNVVIGISGSSGFSTGEHLHFEVRWQGTPVNPEDYLDFGIAPGTPLSSGPLWFPPRPGSGASGAGSGSGSSGSDGAPEEPPTATPTPTETPTPTNTPTVTPTPTITPTPTWTPTPTNTPVPPPPTPTPRPISR